MHLAYVLVTVLAVVLLVTAVAIDVFRTDWIHANMAKYGVPASWIAPLGVIRTSGGVGLVAGIWLPWLGVAAGTGLVLYFLGAVAVIVRSRWFSHVQYPGPFLVASASALALRVVTMR